MPSTWLNGLVEGDLLPAGIEPQWCDGLWDHRLVSEEVAFDPDQDAAGETISLTWVELRDAAGTLHADSNVDLADPADYYGGFKEGDVVSFGPIRRALSDYRGQHEGTTFTWRTSDVLRKWRTLLANDATRTLINTGAVIRMISDQARRRLRLARTIVRGLVRRYKPVSPLLFEFQAEDTLSRLFTTTIPRRLLTVADFPLLPPAAVGKPVPIVYGEASDRSTAVPGLSAPTNFTGTVVGAGGTRTRRYAVTAMSGGDYGHPFYQRPWDHRGETEAVFVDVANCPEAEDLSPANYVELRWDAVAGAAAYRVYGRSAELIKLLDCADIDVTGPVYYDGKRPNGTPELDIQKLDGDPPMINNTAPADTGQGVVPVRYVGDRVLSDGQTWHEFVICCHAVHSILALYQSGVRLANTNESAAGPFLLPGWAGWIAIVGTTTYRDYNGRRYGVIYGIGSLADAAAQGSAPLTLNLIGVEVVGDGTGTPITKACLQYRHFLINFAFQDYQAGAWLDGPAFAADPEPEHAATIGMIDEASFATADAVSDRRVAGGYVGAGVVGEGDQPVLLRDLIPRWNQSCDVDSGFDRKTRFFVDMEDDDAAQLTGATHYTQERDIHENSFDIDDVDTELYTIRPYAYGYRAADGSWTEPTPARDQAAIDAMLGEERIAQRLDLYFVRSAVVAQDIVGRALVRSATPPRLVRWRTGLGALSTELADIILLTHTDGIGPGGWGQYPLRVREHEISPTNFEVELVARDQHYVFRRRLDMSWLPPAETTDGAGGSHAAIRQILARRARGASKGSSELVGPLD